jgi:hypothetical protein
MAVNGTITTAGAAYLSQRISSMTTVTIDHFVMANVPDIDENTEASPDFVLSEENIVATASVYRLAHNGENSVVYSMVLDGNEGDYDFNWYGLVTNTGVILAFAHIPLVAKRANVGQVINRNFILPFTAAKALTGADIPSESWQFDFTETIAEVTVSLLGPRYVYSGDTYTYQFTDWDDFSSYSISSDIGTATLGNGSLTLDIPVGTPEGECLLTVIRNGSTRIIPIRVGEPIVDQPVLIDPVNGAPNIIETPILTMSPFKTFPPDVDTQLSADWELYDANDNLILSSYDDTTNKVSWTLPEGVLTEGGYGYKWRSRHTGQALGDSEWSEFSIFTTKDVFSRNSAPTLIAPVDLATNVARRPTLSISEYSVTPSGFDVVDAVQYRVYSDAEMTNLLWDSGVLTSNFTSVQVTIDLPLDTPHYWTARHRGDVIGWTDYAPASMFTTVQEIVQRPTNVSPSNGATGIGQTQTLTADAFTPIPAGGQTHTASQWQAGNSDFSTIYFDSGTDTTNKTSISATGWPVSTTVHWRVRYQGSDTGWSEWSTPTAFVSVSQFVPTVPGTAFAGGYFAGIMDPADGQRYALVVSPKSTETSLPYANANNTLSFFNSSWDGLSMSPYFGTEFQAGKYCADLEVGGFTDWYLPAIDELELCYRNLKPTTAANETNSGVNTNSDPQGAVYTSGNPARTSATIFQSGNSEAFFGSSYWSSTYSSVYDGSIYRSFVSGMTSEANRTSSYYVRAVRRVLI